MNGTLTSKTIPCAAMNPTAPLRRSAMPGLWTDIGLLLALVATLAAQAFFLIGDPPFINRDAPSYFYVFIALVWLLLTAGALAPSLRQRPLGSKALAPSVILWLTAWGLMGTAWALIVFNRNPDAFWGFWHYERLDPDERIAFLTLVPLAIAPGWFRLGRWVRLYWKNNHSFARCQWAGQCAGRYAQPIKTILILCALAAVAWLFSDRTIMSDGRGLIGCAESHNPIEHHGFREYGSLLLYRYGFRPVEGLGVYASDVIHVINFLATLGSLALIAWLMRLWAFTLRQRRLGWWLTLSTLGLSQMLMGHVEVYPLVQLGLIATAVTGVAALRGRCSLGWCALAYALLLGVHLSGIFIFPAVALVTVLWAYPAAPGNQGKSRPLKAIGLMLGIGLLIHLPLWTSAMLQLDDPTPAGLIQAHLDSLSTGTDQQGFIGTAGDSRLAQLAQIFTPVNSFKLLQLLFYTAGGPLLVALILLLARPLGWPRIRLASSRLRRREALVLLIAWGGYAFYAFTWHNDWEWVEDWDLFCGLASLSLLGVLFALMPEAGRYRLPRRLVRALCLFALALAFSQHYFYHSRATFLNFRGKIALVRATGIDVQRFQFEHGWNYGVQYRVEDGRVIPTEKGKAIPTTALNKHR